MAMSSNAMVVIAFMTEVGGYRTVHSDDQGQLVWITYSA